MGDEPKFWGFKIQDGLATWEWSTMTEAEVRARREARARGEMVPKIKYDFYAYPSRPMREPVLREIRDTAGGMAAFITRNSYGCDILNTAGVMFIDIDAEPPPEPEPVVPKCRRKPLAVILSSTEDRVLSQVSAWTWDRADWGMRVYRTLAGWRLVATHALFDPLDKATDAVMAAFDSDLRYRRLCQLQNCFRARLTPKAWRCGYTKPPTRWPWVPDGDKEAYQKWEVGYQSARRTYATCQLLAEFGSDPKPHPAVQPILDLHDTLTGVGSGLTLA